MFEVLDSPAPWFVSPVQPSPPTCPPEQPHPKKQFKRLVQSHVLRYFRPRYYSLTKPHPIWTTAGPSPYQVAVATVQGKMLLGWYRTERLMRFWSKNRDGVCLLPSCSHLHIPKDIEHVLVHCRSLANTRSTLIEFTRCYADKVPEIQPFITDCLEQFLHHLFRISRTWTPAPLA